MIAELQIGSFGASVILTIILKMVYNTINVPKRAKPWIAIGIGIALGIVAMYYVRDPQQQATFKVVVDYVLQGFMTGATVIGLHEVTKKQE